MLLAMDRPSFLRAACCICHTCPWHIWRNAKKGDAWRGWPPFVACRLSCILHILAWRSPHTTIPVWRPCAMAGCIAGTPWLQLLPLARVSSNICGKCRCFCRCHMCANGTRLPRSDSHGIARLSVSICCSAGVVHRYCSRLWTAVGSFFAAGCVLD